MPNEIFVVDIIPQSESVVGKKLVCRRILCGRREEQDQKKQEKNGRYGR